MRISIRTDIISSNTSPIIIRTGDREIQAPVRIRVAQRLTAPPCLCTRRMRRGEGRRAGAPVRRCCGAPSRQADPPHRCRWLLLPAAPGRSLGPGLPDRAPQNLGGYPLFILARLAQNIAAAPNGFDVIAAGARISKLLAQLTDEDVDDLEFRLIHAAIEMVEEHLFCQGCALPQG